MVAQVTQLPLLPDPKLSDRSGRSSHSYKRAQVREVLKQIEDKTNVVFSRQVEEEDPYQAFYGQHRLLEPTFSFNTLYRVYSESDVLQSCVEAMQNNVDGFGYDLLFLGDDINDKNTPAAQAEFERAKNFFDYANDEESWRTIRKLMREDFEVLGNGAFEVVRNLRGEVQMVFQAPFRTLRISASPGRKIVVDVTLPRNGKMITVKRAKHFRKFAQLSNSGKYLRWFKEIGDPRIMDATTGLYTNSPKVRASEIWHWINPFGGSIYGIPRWIGAVLDVLGRRKGQFLNYDLFENQGIPPMAVMVSGGVLSDDSLDELENIIRGLRGVEKFNRVMLLESNVESVGLEEKGNAKLELKNLTEYRSEDLMFDRYLQATEKTIRHRYRLPPLYVGGAETFTHATAKAAQNIAEEQVFIPEREDFDEPINLHVMRGQLEITLWRYVSKGPKTVGAEEIQKGVKTFSDVGALSINHAIDRANAALGLDMTKLKEPWANYPLPMVLKLLELGQLDDLEGIADVKAIAAQIPAPPQQKLLPGVTQKMFKSDMFNPDEQSLYKLLINIQNAIDTGTFACDV